MILTRPADINGDGLTDWVASDWGHLGLGGTGSAVGAIYITYHD